MNKKQHWENIYSTKELTDVSWYQQVPITAISYLNELQIAKEDAIIDVGGGDSFFVDYLIKGGYKNITVLDISAKALDRAKKRLGDEANKVEWIVADASVYKSKTAFDFWYDRAAFHFLTEEIEVKKYVQNLEYNIAEKGKVVIGTFSEQGPTQCSGIAIKQYSQDGLKKLLRDEFNCVSCQQIDHNTPFDTIQNFTFCSFEKR